MTAVEYDSISEAFAAAIREVAGKVGPGQGVTLTFQPDEALEAAADIERLVAERDAAEAKLKALREAARALVDALESTHGDWPRFCDAPRCCCLAMHDDGDQVACDEHQGMLVDGDVEDLSYAHALRTLRAILEGGSK